MRLIAALVCLLVLVSFTVAADAPKHDGGHGGYYHHGCGPRYVPVYPPLAYPPAYPYYAAPPAYVPSYPPAYPYYVYPARPGLYLRVPGLRVGLEF